MTKRARCPNLRRNLLVIGTAALLALVLVVGCYGLPAVATFLLFASAWTTALVGSLRIALRKRSRSGPSDLWVATAGFALWIVLSLPPVWGYFADLSYVAQHRSDWLLLVEKVRAGEYAEWRFAPGERVSWVSHDAFLRRDPTTVVFALPGFLARDGACFAWSESRPRPLGRDGPAFEHLIGPWWRGTVPEVFD